MALLNLLGYRPELEECVVCRGRLEPVTNYWSAAAGGVVCAGCRRHVEGELRSVSVNALKMLRLLLRGRFEDDARVGVRQNLADELERSMREYVRWVLERDVRSSAFIDTVRHRRPARPTSLPAEEPSATGAP